MTRGILEDEAGCPVGSQVFVMGNAMLRKQTYGNYPAQLNILKAVYEGTQVPFDAAIRIDKLRGTAFDFDR